jgi:hypothetical protein
MLLINRLCALHFQFFGLILSFKSFQETTSLKNVTFLRKSTAGSN